MELGIEAADEALAFEKGEDVVAVAALRLRDEGLEAVVEAEEAEGARAIAQDWIEGTQDAQARRPLDSRTFGSHQIFRISSTPRSR